MEFVFKNKHLEDLYTKGKSKKYKLPEHIKRSFVKKVLIIEAANNIYDLRHPPSNKFEKLQGNDLYSIRVQDKYRLEFRIDFEDESQTQGKVTITNLSNHYGD